jgi:iron complex outermembrane receptor protein
LLKSAPLRGAAAVALLSLAAWGTGAAPARGQDALSPNAGAPQDQAAVPQDQAGRASNSASPSDPQVTGGSGAPALQEVIVTAQRRSQSLQRVPVAMSAIDEESLQRHDVQTLSDLQLVVPSAYVSGYSHGEGQQFFSLRGQSESGLNTGGGAGGGAAVVGYFSEVPTQMAGPGLYYDLKSVQVLNGPQGTLFGRNTTGGAVLFEPQAPDFAGVHGYVQALGGDYRRAETQAAVNLPLIDNVLAMRLAGQEGSREGYTRDVNTGVDYDNRHFRSARAELLFRPSDSLEDYFIGSYVNFDEHGPGAILDAANPANPFVGAAILSYLAAQDARGVRATALSVRELDQETDYSFINKMTLTFSDDLKLRNITSYSRQLARRDDDEDGTTLALLDSLGSKPGTYLVDEGTLTEELQLQGGSAGKALTWQSGVYYEDDYTPGAANHTYTQLEVLLPVYANTDSTDLGGTSTGVYGQATYDLTPLLKGLSVTGGYRYTWDHAYEGYSQSFGVTPFYPAVGDGCSSRAGTYPDCFIAAGARHSGSSYTFGLAYQASAATMLYVTTRQGYKSGGFNLVAASIGATSSPYFSYGPEKVQDIELGTKSDWSLGDTRGRTDLALYDSRLSNAQVNTSALIDNEQEAVTTNAAKATVKGIEIQNVLRPADSIELTLSYSYMDAYYDRYVTPLGEDLTALPYAFAPRNKGSLIGRFRLPVPPADGVIWLGADLSYQDRVFAGFTTVDPGSYMPSYGLLGLRADWTQVWGAGFDASLFVTNVTNKAYRITNEDLYSTIGVATTEYGPPRMFGASVRYRF